MPDLERSATASKCSAADGLLVVIDVQQRLGEAMPGKVLNRVLLNASLLVRAAGMLGIPVLKTEQYPRGLGTTHPSIAEALPVTTSAFEKATFSCCAAEGFLEAVERNRSRQAVLIGMEAHVCVLQTAIDLRLAGLDVFVVEDAVCSRRLENYQNALDRLRHCSIAVVSAESVVFEWLGSSAHPRFKAIQALLR